MISMPWVICQGGGALTGIWRRRVTTPASQGNEDPVPVVPLGGPVRNRELHVKSGVWTCVIPKIGDIVVNSSSLLGLFLPHA